MNSVSISCVSDAAQCSATLNQFNTNKKDFCLEISEPGSLMEINHRGWPVRFRAGLSLIRVLQDLFTLILLHFAILRLKLQFFVVKNLVSGKARYSNSTLLRVHSVKTNPLFYIQGVLAIRGFWGK